MNKKKIIMIAMLCFFGGSLIGVGAGTLCNAKDILYNAGNDVNIDTVEDALNDLYYRVNSFSLYDHVKSKVKGDTSIIDFNTPADIDETGVYKTIGEGNKEVYFYRGNVIDNNVIFAGFCWSIVRTTESEGVKLIYNGVNVDGKCERTKGASIGKSAWNVETGDNAYVGYMYGTPESDNYNDTHANINDSVIKKYLDKWYENNVAETRYEDYLDDVIWCNDRSMKSGGDNNIKDSTYGILGYGKNKTGYGALARGSLYTKNVNPSLVCPQDNDKFTINKSNGNGNLKYPIGLLTLDEAAYAGFTSHTMPDGTRKDPYCTYDNYLFMKEYFWVFTPVSNDLDHIDQGFVFCDLSQSYATYELDVRPSIALRAGIRVTAGDGTAANPFIIE